jgi:hypothetical protein
MSKGVKQMFTGKNPYAIFQALPNGTIKMDCFMPVPTNVIFQGTHTVVIWDDGERTVVNCFDEDFDKEKGLAMALVKRFTNRAEFNRLIDNALVKE